MDEYYFAKCEEIQKGVKPMIIMAIKADNLYGFKNFQINMSYPKKIVGSTISEEYLADKPNFRYKKVNIIMGGNATGKTSLGKLLMLLANYFHDGEYRRFAKVVDDRTRNADLKVDFVTYDDLLCRFSMRIIPGSSEGSEGNIEIELQYTDIGKRDSYEICAKRLNEGKGIEIPYNQVKMNGWNFSYPYDARENKMYRSIENDERYLNILEQVLKTLDPSIEQVIKVKELENTYAIKLHHQSIIIKDGKIADTEILSSGTKAGLEISYIIASLICDRHDFYYCDELFSYVNSDVEKACLSIIIEKLVGKKQLFFTTHNSDILDMQIPKHCFTFLTRDAENKDMPIKCINAADYLKRNTDSLKHAVENDLFCTAPDLQRLFEIAEM